MDVFDFVVLQWYSLKFPKTLQVFNLLYLIAIQIELLQTDEFAKILNFLDFVSRHVKLLQIWNAFKMLNSLNHVVWQIQFLEIFTYLRQKLVIVLDFGNLFSDYVQLRDVLIVGRHGWLKNHVIIYQFLFFQLFAGYVAVEQY